MQLTLDVFTRLQVPGLDTAPEEQVRRRIRAGDETFRRR